MSKGSEKVGGERKRGKEEEKQEKNNPPNSRVIKTKLHKNNTIGQLDKKNTKKSMIIMPSLINERVISITIK